MAQATGTPAQGGRMGRRRALALLGALGLAPRAAQAQESDTPETWACGAARPTAFGMHRLEYMLEGREATAIGGSCILTSTPLNG